MTQYNVAVFFSDTGGGHRSAALAVTAGIEEYASKNANLSPVYVSMDNIAEKSHPINRWFVNLYNYLLRYHQPQMKYYYWFLHLAKPNSSEFGYRISRPYLKKLVEQVNSDVIISVHPMINHYLVRVLKEMGLREKTKFVTVVTDPNADLWQAWACPDVDLLVAPNDLAYNKLVEWGVSKEKLQIWGMPVHPDFLHPPKISREKLLAKLGLAPDRLTICINAGWAGGGNSLNVYRCLDAVAQKVQVIFLCGHNEILFSQVQEEAKHHTKIPTVILPFHENMADLMSACDLMVTKAGGLTTYQAVAKRLPMALDVITEPMPQERGTVDILVEQGLAFPIHKPDDILAIVKRIKHIPNRETLPLPTKHEFDRTHGVYDIAKQILQWSRQHNPIIVDDKNSSQSEGFELPPEATFDIVST